MLYTINMTNLIDRTNHSVESIIQNIFTGAHFSPAFDFRLRSRLQRLYYEKQELRPCIVYSI